MSRKCTLSSDTVNEVYSYCLLKDEEDRNISNNSSIVVVNGTNSQAIMHKDRIAEKQSMISDMIDQLPDEFKEPGGWSFYNGRRNRCGALWTNDDLDIEKLFRLGSAIGRVNFISNGMPFIYINS